MTTKITESSVKRTNRAQIERTNQQTVGSGFLNFLTTAAQSPTGLTGELFFSLGFGRLATNLSIA